MRADPGAAAPARVARMATCIDPSGRRSHDADRGLDGGEAPGPGPGMATAATWTFIANVRWTRLHGMFVLAATAAASNDGTPRRRPAKWLTS